MEGHRAEQIHLVGNVMIDSLLANLERAQDRPALSTLGIERQRYGLVTLHRPSNVDDPMALSRILDALGTVAARVPLIFPVHPRTRSRLTTQSLPAGIRLVDPVGYLDFIALEASALLVLTDSGGVQEETTVLGVPCLTLRETTERPITVVEGTNRVVGTDRDAIIDAATRILDDGVERRRPALWDGHASDRIAEALVGS
jgi:UDP-N-acetylglucosamine 2-epimerase (non-hydrolysing)